MSLQWADAGEVRSIEISPDLDTKSGKGLNLYYLPENTRQGVDEDTASLDDAKRFLDDAYASASRGVSS